MGARIVAGWVLAFIGTMIVIITAIVTLVMSLDADDFVWTGAQTGWAITGAVFFIVGFLLFAGSVLGGIFRK